MSSTTVAMHMSDGIVNAPTSAAFGLVAAAGLGYSLYRARGALDDRIAPMAGLVAAFVFAVQMVNFPVLPGVSGHLLGGALAAILVGPWLGALCVGIVLVVQALLFADGGITALGTNITNIALIGTWTGFVVALALRRLALRNRGALFAVAFASAFVNTVVASLGFVVQYAMGGAGGSSFGTVAVSMIAVHCLIGIGEGLITALTVGAVASARPDLVSLLRGAQRGAQPGVTTTAATGVRS
jgi:cobalt/nickel transport system permease protein